MPFKESTHAKALGPPPVTMNTAPSAVPWHAVAPSARSTPTSTRVQFRQPEAQPLRSTAGRSAVAATSCMYPSPGDPAPQRVAPATGTTKECGTANSSGSRRHSPSEIVSHMAGFDLQTSSQSSASLNWSRLAP